MKQLSLRYSCTNFVEFEIICIIFIPPSTGKYVLHLNEKTLLHCKYTGTSPSHTLRVETLSLLVEPKFIDREMCNSCQPEDITSV